MSLDKQVHTSVGNINIDFIAFVDEIPKPDHNIFAKETWIGLGGAATNYSIAVSRLNHKAKLIARAGKDSIKLGLIEWIKKEGVDITLIEIDKNESTGLAMIIVDRKNGTRTMISARNANNSLKVDRKIDSQHVHISSVDPEILNSLKVDRNKTTISYDPGGIACINKEKTIEAIKKVNWVLINQNEFNCLNSSLTSLINNYIDFIVVKMGSMGARLIDKNNKVHHASYKGKVSQLDPTGAGDAFNAAFNVKYIETKNFETSLRFAVTSGSIKVEKIGSSNSPYLNEINSMLKYSEYFSNI
ncbi:MAG: carbohydrate kinase family protein [Caldisphaera sp.]